MSKIELPKRYRAKDKDSDRYFEGYYIRKEVILYVVTQIKHLCYK